MPRFRSALERLATYTPGKRPEDVGGAADQWVRLSANESPDAPSDAVAEAIVESISGLNRYPSPGAEEMVAAIARHHGVNDACVWAGPGSNTLLYNTATAVLEPGTTAVHADRTFSLYAMAVTVAGAESIEVPLDAHFRTDLDAMLEAIRPDTRMVFISNPNNPTGTYRSFDDVARFVQAVGDDVIIAVDEAYHEYLTAPDGGSVIPLAASVTNALVFRTFSKAHGLAGLRLGYAIGHPDTIAMARRVALPFAVHSIAQAAAIAVMANPADTEGRVAINGNERDRIAQGLERLGYQVVPSQANFLYFATSPGVFERLLAHGVITRSIEPGWLRVTIGAPSDNTRFLEAMGSIAGG